MYFIFGIGAFQAFIFSLLLLTKKEKKEADKFLAGFFFIITLYLANIYSVKFNLWAKRPEIILSITLVSLTYGPLLYFYVQSLIGKEISRKKLKAHLIPIIGTFLIVLPFMFHSKDEKLLYFTDKFINLPLNVSIGTFIQYLSAPIYFIWIILILKKHKQNLKKNHSSIDKINLSWMRKLLFGVSSIWIIDCMNVYALNFTDLEIHYSISWIIKLFFIFFILLIGYYGINQGSIFAPLHEDQSKENNTLTDIKIKLISDETADVHTQTVVDYMQKERVYLDNELRIQDVAINLNISVHILSHIINEKLNQNFYDFVNTYRIEEAKIRLLDKQYNDLTVVAIAYDCGFNSKATFNRLFKQYTGTTPTQYKNSNI
ncbi:MAG: helix-turn-helix domain-containing protein [Bacteroidales bacterium]|nr:helix-turn-helix domain-containing protein [Bacteroidales bacterium]